MTTVVRPIAYRQFLWGLSNGIVMLTLGGAFWAGMAVWASVADWREGWPALAAVILCALALLAAGLRVRRSSAGFRLSEAMADPLSRERTMQIRVGFRWASIAQTALVVLAVASTHTLGRDDLLWPAIALAVSLHFAPIGWLLKMKPYYATAITGSIVAILAMAIPRNGIEDQARLVWLGTGMSAINWLTAIFLVWRAESLAQAWNDGAGS